MRGRVVVPIAVLLVLVLAAGVVLVHAPSSGASSALCVSDGGASENGSTPAIAPATAGWYGNASVSVEAGTVVVHSTGIPSEHGIFPNPNNPNTILPQNYAFAIPALPQIASQCSAVPLRGPIGVALNGVPFFGPYNALGQNAVTHEVFDFCNGHPDQIGAYHYHEYSPCIESSPPGEHSPLIGFAFDGFPIFGPNGTGGVPVPASSLDGCHGHYDASVGEYVYVAETTTFPYVLGCYAGTPVAPY